MKIRIADPCRIEEVLAFYYEVIDAIGNDVNSVRWTKDVYPSRQLLLEALGNGELMTGEDEGGIIAAMILNQNCSEEYGTVLWPLKAEPEDVSVIHALAVHPEKRRNGYARAMVQEALALAEENHRRAVRLDVLKGNTPAEALYAGMGFVHVGTIPMYYEDTGTAEFLLFELPLSSGTEKTRRHSKSRRDLFCRKKEVDL